VQISCIFRAAAAPSNDPRVVLDVVDALGRLSSRNAQQHQHEDRGPQSRARKSRGKKWPENIKAAKTRAVKLLEDAVDADNDAKREAERTEERDDENVAGHLLLLLDVDGEQLVVLAEQPIENEAKDAKHDRRQNLQQIDQPRKHEIEQQHLV